MDCHRQETGELRTASTTLRTLMTEAPRVIAPALPVVTLRLIDTTHAMAAAAVDSLRAMNPLEVEVAQPRHITLIHAADETAITSPVIEGIGHMATVGGLVEIVRLTVKSPEIGQQTTMVIVIATGIETGTGHMMTVDHNNEIAALMIMTGIGVADHLLKVIDQGVIIADLPMTGIGEIGPTMIRIGRLLLTEMAGTTGIGIEIVIGTGTERFGIISTTTSTAVEWISDEAGKVMAAQELQTGVEIGRTTRPCPKIGITAGTETGPTIRRVSRRV